MERKEIMFDIDHKGGITFTVKGVKGRSCVDLAEGIKALGKVVEERRTTEFFEETRMDSFLTTKTWEDGQIEESVYRWEIGDVACYLHCILGLSAR